MPTLSAYQGLAKLGRALANPSRWTLHRSQHSSSAGLAEAYQAHSKLFWLCAAACDSGRSAAACDSGRSEAVRSTCHTAAGCSSSSSQDVRRGHQKSGILCCHLSSHIRPAQPAAKSGSQPGLPEAKANPSRPLSSSAQHLDHGGHRAPAASCVSCASCASCVYGWSPLNTLAVRLAQQQVVPTSRN
jgi:hypothetical protein